MTEREKVIKWLREIKEWVAEPNGVGSIETDIVLNAVNGALALLKAQEPDETRLVRHYSRPNVYADLWLHCEKCGGVVDDIYRPKFCPECGRKVKWE